jgi:hypothetical protein
MGSEVTRVDRQTDRHDDNHKPIFPCKIRKVTKKVNYQIIFKCLSYILFEIQSLKSKC